MNLKSILLSKNWLIYRLKLDDFKNGIKKARCPRPVDLTLGQFKLPCTSSLVSYASRSCLTNLERSNGA